MAPSESRPTRLRNGAFITAGAIAAIVIGMLVVFATAGQPADPTPTETPHPTPTVSPSPRLSPTARPTPSPSPSPTPIARCPLDGQPLATGVDIPTTALAVQIENHPAARPTRNLSRADMVLETTVEGDMTRFTAVYLCDETLGLTGPVRSARYYNIDFWQDIHVLTVAFGRSDGAYARFVDAGMPFANGMDGGWPWFQRYGSAAAPHNLYLDLEAMRVGLDADASLRGLADAVNELRAPFTFDELPDLAGDGRPVAAIEIRTNGYWTFGWTWDGEGAWRRIDGGEEAMDEATGEPVAATSVVVQRVTQETVYGDPDPGGNPRRLQHLVGSGPGTVYVGGNAYAIEWRRGSEDEGTTFTFADTGQPVVLPPGQVWWEIIPVESSLTES